ncbi:MULTISPECIES: helix-turn-helix domain-containing protein [Streptomyces]|uniref:helix-turn-helix domain-containing protein n=1 Tax=Streptomyces TaxID=1883 RepID=UPI0016722882|nr:MULTISPECIES: helix-turn-helix transcriptional regulator [Streptomyces]MBD3574924.1 helix-turn-helix transcriptional regulator [Streptomyces sp. KD18]GGS83321.1 transcriptional regulator [Streptomyces toxytricini]
MPPRKTPDASANVPSFYGAELRYQRELAGLTLEQLAAGSFRGVPFLSQIERGERRMPLDLARHVDAKLGTDGFFERRCEDARKAKQSGHAEYFANVAEMEGYAETIEEWAPSLVPGLLQTAAYATAVVHTSLPWLRPEAVEKQVSARMERARLWDREERPAFWAILHESLIRKPLLGNADMADQLDHVVRVVRCSQSVLQIVPETASAHPMMMGMIKVMTFPDAPPVVYTEGLHSGQLIDYPALVKDYRRSYDLLRAAALPPEASLAMVEQAAEDYRDGNHTA